jgi:glycosyltransferase involved in cell wall biosynthesis
MVTIAIPTLNEEAHIEACLDAIDAQTYRQIVEVLVVDGGSRDTTRELAERRPGVTVIDNPRRIQAAALNIALERAKGDVFVRVDGHCVLADDYVERCVEALESTGAAVVGGGMTPVATGDMARAISKAMASRWGAGPARFHVGGSPGWTDTVYLGACRVALARALGGYDESVGVNEDAEFAIRMQSHGGVWFDPSIRSTYVPRDSIRAVARQFYRYGRSRAATVRRHPTSLAPRQLAAPILVAGLASPWRRGATTVYLAFVIVVAVNENRQNVGDAVRFGVVLPTMHLSWGAGFLSGALARRDRGTFTETRAR